MDNELYHYGRKGMKWYQNIFTSGKKGSSRKSSSAKKKTQTKAKTAEEKPKTKSLSEMTDAEINQAINRKRLEDQYRAAFPRKVSVGEEIVKSVLKDVVAPAAVSAGRTILTDALNKAGKEILGVKPEKQTNWADLLKQQTYENNKAKYEYEDLKRKHDIAKERYEYKQWQAEVKKKKKEE